MQDEDCAKSHAASLWNGPSGAKPKPVSPNHLRYYTAESGNSLPTFQDNLSVPPSRVKRSKREHCTTEVDKIFSFGLCPSTNFLRSTMFLKPAVFPFNQAKKHLTWLILWTELFSITGYHRSSNLLRYVPDNRSSPWVVTRKWIFKN